MEQPCGKLAFQIDQPQSFMLLIRIQNISTNFIKITLTGFFTYIQILLHFVDYLNLPIKFLARVSTNDLFLITDFNILQVQTIWIMGKIRRTIPR